MQSGSFHFAFETTHDALTGTPLKRTGVGTSSMMTPDGTPACSATPKRGRSPGSRSTHGDRFIPHRSAMDLDVSHFELTRSCQNENAGVNASPAKEEYKKELAANLFAGNAQNKVLAFQSKSPRPADDSQNSLRVLYTQNRDAGLLPKRYSRHIPQAPERILDAPELLDDYYLNLLDWNASNVLGVALGDSIYLWNATDGSITQLMQTQGEQTHVTSLSWVQEGNYMAVGTSDHKVQIWDVERLKQVRCMNGHRARVSSLSWNGPLLSSGGRDSVVMHHDVRVAEHKVGTLRGHVQEVCGLKWSPSGNQLASGGNDNILNIWDDRYTSSANGVCDQPLFRCDQHQAAVKALAWCPWQRHLLASGGGTADRMIRFWNSNNGACLNAVDTHSQVCALQWAKHDKELVSSHGYSHNQLILWKYPSMVKVAELTGHTSRVLHMAQSPDGTTVVTAAADETLRFWKILSGGEASKKERAAAKESILNTMSIR